MAGGGGAAGARGRPLDAARHGVGAHAHSNHGGSTRVQAPGPHRGHPPDGSYLRTTWHAERRAFVVSTWRDEVCTGAVRVPVGAAGELARLLIDGLAEAATSPAPTGPTAKTRGRPDMLARARAWLHRLRLSA